MTYNGDEATVSALQMTTLIDEPPVLPEEWTQALANVGLGPGTPGMSNMFGAGIEYGNFGWQNYLDLQTMLPGYWDHWYAHPSLAPQYMKDNNDFFRDADTLQELILDAGNEFPEDKRPTAQTHSETLDPTNPLAVAVADLVTSAGGVPNQGAYETALDPLSDEDQEALAPLIYAVEHALDLRQTALEGMGFNDTLLPDFFSWAHGDPLGGILLLRTDSYIPLVWDVTGATPTYLLRGFDYVPFFEGACYLADAVDDLSAYLATSPVFEDVNLNVVTPLGNITIGGTGSDAHQQPIEGNGHLVLIDLGGADTYNCHAGGTASYLNGVSLCVDLGTDNDIYARIDDPDDIDRTLSPPDDNTSQQGAGRFGIGMLVDYGGVDSYSSVRLSQGSCVFGVGVLADYGLEGDTYAMEALGQGGAFAGIALLYNQGGEDQYSAWNKCQGFGSLMGVGYLVDQGDGVDSYYAERAEDATKPEYYADAYSTNISNCQGAGWGARWGWLSFGTPAQDEVGSGGLGVLFDGGGSDVYECGTFGQGSGFYQSVGMLLDNDGSDIHTGHWYTQGATAHAAVGLMRDGGGDDSYTNDASIGIGGAHDWSVTWFYEWAGGETYDGANLGLASGYSNGFAYFLDLAGNDSYSCQGANENTTLGKGNLGDANRPDMPTYGILLDLAGNDTYDPVYQTMTGSTGLPGNNASWLRPADGTYLLGKGSGLDAQ